METNILGLPSLTGYTPLKAYREGQVLKYDFKGIGPKVMDKSGHGNLGRLKPREDPPRRKVVSWFPLKVALKLDGENDLVNVPDSKSLRMENGFRIDIEIKSRQNKFLGRTYPWTFLVWKGCWPGNYSIHDGGDGRTAFRIFDAKENEYGIASNVIEYGKRIRLGYIYNPGKGEIRIEKNGETVESKTIGDVTPLYTGDQPVVIGGEGRQNYIGDMSYLSIKRL